MRNKTELKKDSLRSKNTRTFGLDCTTTRGRSTYFKVLNKRGEGGMTKEVNSINGGFRVNGKEGGGTFYISIYRKTG